MIRNCVQKAKHEKKVASKKNRGGNSNSSGAKSAAASAIEERRAKLLADTDANAGEGSRGGFDEAEAERAAEEESIAYACSLSDGAFRDVLRFRNLSDPLGVGGRPPYDPRRAASASASVLGQDHAGGEGSGERSEQQQQLSLSKKKDGGGAVGENALGASALAPSPLEREIPSDRALADVLRQAEGEVDDLQEGLNSIHGQLSDASRTCALPPPSKTFYEFMTQTSGKWPCTQNVTEMVQGQPGPRFKIWECITCRGTDPDSEVGQVFADGSSESGGATSAGAGCAAGGAGGCGGQLRLVCEYCMHINHRRLGHKVRPMGSAYECDDSRRKTPWDMELWFRDERSLKGNSKEWAHLVEESIKSSA
jgi:hypothetical protein